MRSTVIAMIVVAILSAAICVFAIVMIDQTVTEVDAMRLKVLEKAENDDIEGAHEQLAQLAEMWSRRANWLEILTSHEDLQQVSELIIEANANYEVGDTDDFLRSIALLGFAIEHIYAEEQFKLSNIL